MKLCWVAQVIVFLHLLFTFGCSSKESPKISLLRNLDHTGIVEEMVSYFDSGLWPKEKLFFKIDPTDTKPKFPVPSELAAFEPWGCFVFPDNPPRVEFAFWTRSGSAMRDTVSLGYVVNGGDIEEGTMHEEADLEGTKVSVSAIVEKIAESTYLVTPDR